MLTDTFKKLARLAWFLPGFLLWAAFPPMGEGSDCLFALAPLLWLARRDRPGVSAKRWFQNGLFFWVATLAWMPAIVKNGGPWPLVVLGWFALAAYCAGYFALFGWLAAKYWDWARGTRTAAHGGLSLRLFGVLIVEPVLWCGLELVRARLFGGFAWNSLGVVPANFGFGAPAALGGVYLCSAVVILVNGSLAGIAERVWKPERSGFACLRKFGSLETVAAFALIFGFYAAAKAEAAGRGVRDAGNVGGASLKVALVQRNFPCVFKAQEDDPYAVYSNLLQNVALLKPDLVVLAESALCEFGPVDQQGALRFAAFVREQTGAALLAGGTRYEDGKTYNSAALYGGLRGDGGRRTADSGDGRAEGRDDLQVYDKVHLVPFGEFIPGDKWFPALQRLAPVGSCTPGEPRLLTLNAQPSPVNPQPSTLNPQRPTLNSHPSTPLGVAICFEDTDSALMRRAAAQGAKALVFITNDSWFSQSDEALAHAWQATARAIETGLPVVRVGNSGVTGTITPQGQATWLLGAEGRPLVDRRGTLFDRIPLADGAPRPTFYVRWGDVPLAVAFALLMCGLLLVGWRSARAL